MEEGTDAPSAKSKCMPNVGIFYAMRLVDGVLQSDADDGVVRCSFLHYNTVEEVNALIEVLDEILCKR
jgi:selenocysteine lyase/cysteine desulfurase